MMYSDKLVVAVKVKGRVLRENGDTVTLPFGCEYSILIKNLNSVRSQVNVSVDGQDAAGQLIIGPNSSLELERFIRNGNLQAGNRFKFIERTAGIEKHRGVGSDDGLIRVEGWREHVREFVNVPITRYYDDPYPVPRPYPVYPYPRPWYPRPFSPWCSSSTNASMGGTTASVNLTSAGASAKSGGVRGSSRRPGQPMMRGTPPRPDVTAKLGTHRRNVSEAGITVPGSESQQQFRLVSGFPLEPTSVVIVLRLRGEVAGQPVAEPVTVDAKPTCQTCGKASKGSNQFCGRCGTALVLV